MPFLSFVVNWTFAAVVTIFLVTATSTVAVWPGSLGSMWAYRQELGASEPRLARIVDGLGRSGEPVVFPAHPRTRSNDGPTSRIR